MITRRMLYLFILLVGILALSACVAPAMPAESETDAEAVEATADDEPISIAFVSHTRDVTDLFGQDRKSVV